MGIFGRKINEEAKEMERASAHNWTTMEREDYLEMIGLGDESVQSEESAEPRKVEKIIKSIREGDWSQQQLEELRVCVEKQMHKGPVLPVYMGPLHCHPAMQQKLGVDKDHVIVDKEDWLRARC